MCGEIPGWAAYLIFMTTLGCCICFWAIGVLVKEVDNLKRRLG